MRELDLQAKKWHDERITSCEMKLENESDNAKLSNQVVKPASRRFGAPSGELEEMDQQ